MLATNIVTADQYMAVVLPARMFKKAIAERGLAPVVLGVRMLRAEATQEQARRG